MAPDETQRGEYRWHELMWRLAEMDELAANGLPEDEVRAFDGERASIRQELTGLESAWLPADVARLRGAHERDRAYREQLRQMEDEEP